MDKDTETLIRELVSGLAENLGRLPTPDEVMGFINGDDETRLAIYNNKGVT